MATILEALGTYIDTNRNDLTLGTNLFLSKMPETPDVAVCIYETAGFSPMMTFGSTAIQFDKPGVQIAVRAGRDAYATARDLAVALRTLVAGIVDTTVGGKRILRVEASGSVYSLSPDDLDRPRVVFNLDCHVGVQTWTRKKFHATFTDEGKIVTNSQDVGAVTESSRSTSLDLGNSTAPDVKQQINKFSNLDNLLDSYEPAKKVNGAICSVFKMYEQIPLSTQERLNKLMDNKSVTSGEICKLLKTFDLTISVEVMRRHRRRKTGTGCACP